MGRGRQAAAARIRVHPQPPGTGGPAVPEGRSGARGGGRKDAARAGAHGPDGPGHRGLRPGAALLRLRGLRDGPRPRAAGAGQLAGGRGGGRTRRRTTGGAAGGGGVRRATAGPRPRRGTTRGAGLPGRAARTGRDPAVRGGHRTRSRAGHPGADRPAVRGRAAVGPRADPRRGRGARLPGALRRRGRGRLQRPCPARGAHRRARPGPRHGARAPVAGGAPDRRRPRAARRGSGSAAARLRGRGGRPGGGGARRTTRGPRRAHVRRRAAHRRYGHRRTRPAAQHPR